MQPYSHTSVETTFRWRPRRMARAVVAGVAGLLLLVGCTSPPGPPPDGVGVVGVEVPPLPAASTPIPVAADSYPFLAAHHATTPLDLRDYGYEEREYFISGVARLFTWPTIESLRVESSHQYTTRVVVRRPADQARFSGRVRVEPLNPTSGHDLDAQWGIAHSGFLHRGDAWVGVTIAPAPVAALKRFDPGRYAPLSIPEPSSPSDPDCVAGTRNGPGDASGLAWDIISQVGALVRSTSPGNPLVDLAPQTSTLTGWSQGGSYLLTYMNAMAPHVTAPGGGPVFDSYLAGAGGYAGTPISRCAPLPESGDPRTRFTPPPGAPVVVVSTPTDFASAASWPRPTDRPADSDTPDRRIRLYEVGGGSHLPADRARFLPNDEQRARAGFSSQDRVAYAPSDFPLHVVLNAAFVNLDAWVARGVPPPRAQRLTVANPGQWPPEPARDPFGNPLGGVRTPAVDVPTASYLPRGLDAPRSNQSDYAGYAIPFSPGYLRVLYPTHADYVGQVSASARALQAGRWLTPEDADRLIGQAIQASVPGP